MAGWPTRLRASMSEVTHELHGDIVVEADFAERRQHVEEEGGYLLADPGHRGHPGI